MSRRLLDSYGRVADDLRISVTDRCNFRCVYCMPAEGLQWLARDDILSFEEIERLARLLVLGYGVRTIRLTGGEPLVRAHLEVLVGMLNDIDPDLDLTMTTNAMGLRQKARALRDAGLKRINISLDTLRPERFKAIARREGFDRVWAGIEAAQEVGLDPIKINVVVLKDVNDDEAPDFAGLARERGFEVRFIEFMPLDGDGTWTRDRVVPGRVLKERIEERHPLVARPRERPGASSDYVFADGAPGAVGFISSVSQAFCGTCNRLRLSAEGGLRTCLFSHQETPLRELLRNGAGDDEIARVVETAIWRKEAGHLINEAGFIRPEKSMSQIGG